MAGEQFQEARRSALAVVGLQLAIGVVGGLIALAVAGPDAAASTLGGGLIGVLASLTMVWKLFSGGPEADPKRWLRGLLLGEASKFGITVVLFTIAIVIFKAAFLPLILGYIATFAAYWIGLLKLGVR